MVLRIVKLDFCFKMSVYFSFFVDVFCTLVDHLECDATASSSLSVRNEPEEERKFTPPSFVHAGLS